MTPAELRKLFPRRIVQRVHGLDGYCLDCERPLLDFAQGRCTPCMRRRELEKERAEQVARFLGVDGCVACGSVWLHSDMRGEPVVAFCFCTTCGKIQPAQRRWDGKWR